MLFFAQANDAASKVAEDISPKAQDGAGFNVDAETWDELRDMLMKWAVEGILDVFFAVIILIIGWWLSAILSRSVRRGILVARPDCDPVIVQLVGKIVRISVLIFTAVAMLGAFGVQTASIIAAIGASMLAIGMSLQGSLSNVASGVLLLVLRPFDLGHAVKIGGEVVVIDEIGLFVTRGHSPDGPQMVVPNSKITAAETVNYSVCHEDQRRINETIGIGYDDDINKAREVIAQVLQNEPGVLPEPAHQVLVDSLGESSVNIVVRAFTKRADWWDTRCEVIKKIKEALDANGISIPFPQRDLHIYSAGEAEETA